MTTAQQPTVDASKGKKIVLGLTAVFLTYLVYSYFTQILLSAFPKIAAQLHGMPLYSWGVSIPNLGLAFAMLLVGKLSDMYGRRALFVASLAISLLGALLCAFSPSFKMLIIARTILSIGQGGLAPLCFSTLGDMFEPVQRSKWIGLLNIPAGIFALRGAKLGGWFVDGGHWRSIFWWGVPLLIMCLIMVMIGLAGKTRIGTSKIDSRGSLLAAVASSTMILGFSMPGMIDPLTSRLMYPWTSTWVLGLLGLSVVSWLLFLKVEFGAEEPILDIQLLKNRSFITLASAGLLSSFGLTGLMAYYPLLLQGIQKVTASRLADIMTPGIVLMSFMGVPAGFILARTKRYKWMFILGYGMSLAVMIALILFKADTSIYWAIAAFTLAGIGMGSIPTLNTLVAQYAIPKRLLGVAMGALYFTVIIGTSLAPAILGTALNMKYASTFQSTLPAELSDRTTIDSGVLMDEKAMMDLRTKLVNSSGNGQDIFDKTVLAIKFSLQSALRLIFIIGAVTMLMTFLLICTIPKISIDIPAEEQKGLG
jgi:MFS family permease